MSPDKSRVPNTSVALKVETFQRKKFVWVASVTVAVPAGTSIGAEQAPPATEKEAPPLTVNIAVFVL